MTNKVPRDDVVFLNFHLYDRDSANLCPNSKNIWRAHWHARLVFF